MVSLATAGNAEFNKLVRENAIVTDAESADNLFKILSQNRASESSTSLCGHLIFMIPFSLSLCLSLSQASVHRHLCLSMTHGNW